MALILVLEDDVPIAELLRDHLLREGHTVELCHDGALGLAQIQARAFDLVVLDLMLPGKGGLEVCRELRRMPGAQPVVLMLTARAQEEDLCLGYDVGADDYVKKPFSVRELLLRVVALLRLRGRSLESKVRTLDAGRLAVDLAARRVHAGSEEVRLTPMEYALLLHLLQRPGEVVPRERLLAEVWGYSHSGYLRTVDTHVTRVRKKLVAAGADADMLRTVFGVGYAFEPRPSK
jgi:DNA-binding response OmpR family regulator